MKTKTLLAMGLCAAIGIVSIQTSHAEATNQTAEAETKVQIPDTVDGIWKEIKMHHQELADVIKAKELSKVHEHAFAIRDLVKALPAKTNPEHKKPIELMVKKISQIATDLDKYGDAGDQAKTEANLTKMDDALKKTEDLSAMAPTMKMK